MRQLKMMVGILAVVSSISILSFISSNTFVRGQQIKPVDVKSQTPPPYNPEDDKQILSNLGKIEKKMEAKDRKIVSLTSKLSQVEKENKLLREELARLKKLPADTIVLGWVDVRVDTVYSEIEVERGRTGFFNGIFKRKNRNNAN